MPTAKYSATPTRILLFYPQSEKQFQRERKEKKRDKQDEEDEREDAAARAALVLDLATAACAARDDDLDRAAVVRGRDARDRLVRAADDVHRRRRALAVALGAVRVVYRDTLVRRHAALLCSQPRTPRVKHPV